MTRLSNRQFPMLRMFATQGADFHMSIEEAQQWDQRPFRSMLIQKWVIFKPGKGFQLTKEGKKHWEEFGNTDIARVDATKPLTAYFDMSQYGVPRKPSRPKKRAPMPTKRQAAMMATVH